MNIVDHNDKGATIHLDQRELLMVMALVQEGRHSFECEGQTGKSLDQLFSSANVLVEEARRREIIMPLKPCTVGDVAAPETESNRKGANG